MQKGLQEDYKWTKKELLDGRIYDVEKRRTRRINPRFWQVLQALAPGALRSEYLRNRQSGLWQKSLGPDDIDRFVPAPRLHVSHDPVNVILDGKL